MSAALRRPTVADRLSRATTDGWSTCSLSKVPTWSRDLVRDDRKSIHRT